MSGIPDFSTVAFQPVATAATTGIRGSTAKMESPGTIGLRVRTAPVIGLGRLAK